MLAARALLLQTMKSQFRGLVLLVLFVKICQGRPMDDSVHNYLMAFGYLPQSDLETGNLRSEDQLTDALRNMQFFAKLPVTGKLDKATQKLLKTPRCGMPDLATASFRSKRGTLHIRRKRYTLQGQKWHTTNLTWSLRTNARGLDHGRVRSELGKALRAWQDNSQLNFTEVNSNDADILVHFYRGFHDDGYPFDGRGTVLAHAFFPGTGRGGDAHFDEEEMWLLHGDSGDGTSLFNVAAHEFGHSLGLSHSSQRDALMFPWYQGSKGEFTLPPDDRNGIQQLYGSRGRLWEKIPNYRPPDVRTTVAPPTRYTTRYPGGRPNPTERPQPPPPPPPSSGGDGKPDSCDTSYDAISIIRRETFIFKDKWFWRIGDKGLYQGYPVETTRFWTNLPTNFTHVDAVYEREDKKIVFFIGRQFWLYNANEIVAGYPRPITDLGLPATLNKIDGAMVWGHNGKTYFFSGTMYWRFDEAEKKVELDYPRDMSMWSGVDYNIDGVFQWKDGITYFFKGKTYWKFNDQKMRVQHESPMLSAPFWMGCPTMGLNEVGPARAEVRSDPSSGSVRIASKLILLGVFLSAWLQHRTPA